MAQEARTFAVGGGLDQASPALAVPAGRARSSMNYEPLAEGYGLMEGFERYDGALLPSEQSYWLLQYDQGSSPFVEGQTVTGMTSGATGVLLLDPIAPSGSWGAGTAAGTIILTNVSGTFQNDEILRVAGTPKAIAVGTAVREAATAYSDHEAWLELAQAWQRARITPAPGSGPVRGSFIHAGSLYAVRDNVGATHAAIWKATSTGWQAGGTQSFTLPFTAGLVEIIEGQAIAGATSGAGGVVRRVVRQSGDWGSTAAGYLVITGVSGTFQAEAIKVGAANVATIGGAATENKLPAGGRYSFARHNFYGASNRRRIYGANGIGNAFEFDTEFLAFVQTGTPLDRPTHIAVHRDSLALGFRGGSLQLSVPGEPLSFDGELGAAEFGIGADITDLQSATETALAVFAQSKIGILSGGDVDTYQWDTLTDQAGAYPWSAQSVGQVIYMDNRGLRGLSGAQTLANFKIGAFSELIEPLLRAKRKAGVVPVLSYACKSKGQYRLLLTDGTGLNVYMGRKAPEIMAFETGDTRFTHVCVDELETGEEVMFACAEDGYVYRLDSGTSHDGAAMNGFVMFPFNHVGSPFIEKRWHGAQVELDAAPQTRIGMTAQFDYADGEQPHDGALTFFVTGASNRDFVVEGGGGIWDASTWDEFYWSAPFEGQAWTDIDGIGTNMSLLVAARPSVVEPRHILKSYTLFHSNRKMRRRYG